MMLASGLPLEERTGTKSKLPTRSRPNKLPRLVRSGDELTPEMRRERPMRKEAESMGKARFSRVYGPR